MEILLNEQDMVDSICVYVASLENQRPEDIEVDLKIDQLISAVASFNRFEQRYLEEQEIVDVIAFYLRDYYSFDPHQLRIDLRFSEEEGFGASILVE